MASSQKIKMPTIDLGLGRVAKKPSDLVAIIISATDQQVLDKNLPDAAARDEFAMGSDALNLWRLIWRCREQWGLLGFSEEILAKLKSLLYEARGYDADEFESAIEATRGRARLPFGWTALDLAWNRAQREPIRLLRSELAGKVPSAIANIAYQLQKIQGSDSILLPIDQLRILLAQRKIVVSGSVLRLVEAKIIQYTDATYHTKKAREFKFTGVEGEHFEIEKPSTKQG